MHHHESHGWHHRRRFPWVGLMLVVLGGWWFASEVWGVPFEWAWIAPIALVLVGVSMLMARGWGGHGCWCCGRGWKEESTQTTLPTQEVR